jgi:hypothetical protein
MRVILTFMRVIFTLLRVIFTLMRVILTRYVVNYFITIYYIYYMFLQPACVSNQHSARHCIVPYCVSCNFKNFHRKLTCRQATQLLFQNHELNIFTKITFREQKQLRNWIMIHETNFERLLPHLEHLEPKGNSVNYCS